MRVVIAGGHGKIALIVERLLSQRGDSVAGLIRNPAQAADLEAAGAEAIVVDLEHSSVGEVSSHVRGADAALDAGVRRYLMVSATVSYTHLTLPTIYSV